VLRRLKIDELPQVLNIVRSEMSLVGPRPLPVEDLEHSDWLNQLPEDARIRCLDWRRRREAVRPGLTGMWQVSRNAEEDFDNWITCDLTYAETCSLWTDLRIFFCTPWAIIRGRRQRVKGEE